ncbi:MAG TPA: HesA/MoeB/ThiF family protein [Bacteroidales bacterium]|nr:HesA/MoeB/ThiF family protein [Bacteroidales bacterium]
MLTDTEKNLYDRHLIIPDFGIEAQEKLKAARILIAGAGGLGSPVAIYLAAAGVGNIGIADADVVSLSNLQRQIMYSYSDIGKSKVAVASQKLSVQNPFIQLHPYQLFLTEFIVDNIIKDYDVIIGALDNAPARYMLSDACIRQSKAYIHGAISNFTGQVTVFNYKGGKTYRDLFSEPLHPSNMSPTDKGVFAPLPGLIGTLMAAEVIKVITGCGEVLSGKMLVVDLKANLFQVVNY